MVSCISGDFWRFFWVFAPQRRFVLLIHHVEFVSGDLKRKPSASVWFFLGMPKVSLFRLLLGQLSGLLLAKRARVPIPVAGSFAYFVILTVSNAAVGLPSTIVKR